MSSEAASYFVEALPSPSEGRWSAQGARVRHLNPNRVRLHKRTLLDARQSFNEFYVNPHPRTHDILVNTADTQSQMADLFDYNVAHNSQNDPEFCRKPICFISRSGVL
jgi:hypothetical protein